MEIYIQESHLNQTKLRQRNRNEHVVINVFPAVHQTVESAYTASKPVNCVTELCDHY